MAREPRPERLTSIVSGDIHTDGLSLESRLTD